ncbi:MAG: nuclear transport factor 2 family protein [Alphaproteobacteria bacterium]|nr:nuclear transport factor 2 family protein [Alphaproteobacteria bacterium]
MANRDRVLAFIAAWERKDVDAIIAAMTSDAVYHNIPMPPVQGHEAIRALIAQFLTPAEAVRWAVHAIAETANGTVLTERTDTFQMAGGKIITLPVMGAFEFRDGKISAWRDYFDLAQFQSQMA